MILFDLCGENESHPAYSNLEIDNQIRLNSFLDSALSTARLLKRHLLSKQLVKAFNYHAIVCLHSGAGEYRSCSVKITDNPDDIPPPAPHRVSSLMDDFIDSVNRYWTKMGALELGAYVFWRLNYIHPFINGNGRTARAACQYVIGLKNDNLLKGKKTLSESLKENRNKYIDGLISADMSFRLAGCTNPEKVDLTNLCNLLDHLITEQLKQIV
ncbi:filamentation induced by cAMP protein fic [Komagataeibacter diospyri]|uniref:Fic family protein n=1 Tax=Komagataeibacter diospyri TaxID=1932662 RepID=UPI00113C422B|nr:Fic family protein [Komagataeibacter diospyri]GCE90914.1 filamentation induced by cAMP protein fic [Komagataeibacter diospyri]